MHILLAEDDRTTRVLLARVLTRWGYEVTAVADGAEALSRIRAEGIRLVVSDWDMPDLDGPTLVRRLREQREPYVYVVLVTSYSDPEHAVFGLEAGADDFIGKPCDTAELRARLNVGRRILALQDDLAARADALRRANVALSLIAATDPLCEIGNRRSFDEALARVHARRAGYGVLMADIDHFKVVNDTHGHAAGDRVLVAAARATCEALGDDGELFRYGGEELVAIVPGATSVEGLRDIAERMRVAVEATQVRRHDGRALAVTLSVGGTLRDPTGDEAAEAVLKRADDALFAAKEGGRNRVVMG